MLSLFCSMILNIILRSILILGAPGMEADLLRFAAVNAGAYYYAISSKPDCHFALIY